MFSGESPLSVAELAALSVDNAGLVHEALAGAGGLFRVGDEVGEELLGGGGVGVFGEGLGGRRCGDEGCLLMRKYTRWCRCGLPHPTLSFSPFSISNLDHGGTRRHGASVPSACWR